MGFMDINTTWHGFSFWFGDFESGQCLSYDYEKRAGLVTMQICQQ